MSLAVVRRFTLLPEAEVAASYLKAYGIPATVFDRHILSGLPDAYFATGGFRVTVPEEELGSARELFSTLMPIEPKPGHEEPPVDESPGGRAKSALGVLWGLFSGVPFAPRPRRDR